jgi:hypothetical protein
MPSLISSRGGYALSAALVVAGIAVGVIGVVRLVGSVESMPRVMMPGKASVELPAGDSAIFVETRSVIHGIAVVSQPPANMRCLVEGTADDPVLVVPSREVTYVMGSYEGRLVYDVEGARAGTHQVSCESDGGQFVLAFASGPMASIGTRLVVVMLSSTLLVLAGLTLGGVVVYRRSSVRRRAGAPLGAIGLPIG